MRDLLPKHPRLEGAALAFFGVAITAYASLLLYVLTGWCLS